MRLAPPITTAALVVLTLSACGSGGGDSGPGKPVSGAQAADQARTLNEKLDGSLSTYREGDRDGAASQFTTAREDHWTPIREAVRRSDAALEARVDSALTRELPRLIDQGVTVTQLARPLASVEADVDRAAVKLRGT